jgi:hypothetical protein
VLSRRHNDETTVGNIKQTELFRKDEILDSMKHEPPQEIVGGDIELLVKEMLSWRMMLFPLQNGPAVIWMTY